MKCFKCTKKVLIPVFAVIAAAIVIAAYYLFLAEKPNNYAKNVTLIINNGGDDITIEAGTNAGYVSEFLIQLKDEGKLTFTADNDPALGLQITGINGVRQNEGDNINKWYLYSIKGKDDTGFNGNVVGISQQVINDGDIIKFELKEFTY